MSPRLRELFVSYRAHPSGAHVDTRQITTAASAAAILVPVLENQPTELFVILHLDTKLRVLGLQEIARGGLNVVDLPIRSIVTGCLASRNSRAIICAHNHPSGDPDPSPEDLALTVKIAEACRLFEIDVLDHLIIGNGSYCSLKESGRWERP